MRTALALLLLGACPLCFAQKWVDENGKVYYGAPPAGVYVKPVPMTRGSAMGLGETPTAPQLQPEDQLRLIEDRQREQEERERQLRAEQERDREIAREAAREREEARREREADERARAEDIREMWREERERASEREAARRTPTPERVRGK